MYLNVLHAEFFAKQRLKTSIRMKCFIFHFSPLLLYLCNILHRTNRSTHNILKLLVVPNYCTTLQKCMTDSCVVASFVHVATNNWSQSVRQKREEMKQAWWICSRKCISELSLMRWAASQTAGHGCRIGHFVLRGSRNSGCTLEKCRTQYCLTGR